MSKQQEQEIKELIKIIKECGAYSIELDGYVINPTTVAYKLSNSGYVNINNIKLTAIDDDVIIAVKPTSGEWHTYAREHNKPETDQNSYFACWITKAVQAQLAHNLRELGK